jgi:hypothetical protein
MKIYDLTNGKYSDIFNSTSCSTIEECINELPYLIRDYKLSHLFDTSDIKSKLQEIPVFLVETSMKEKQVAVPNCNSLIQIPSDLWSEENNELNLEEWLNKKEAELGDKELISQKREIYDLLGVYVSEKNETNPKKIFIWMDKIVDYASGSTENAKNLFELVFAHEMAHGLMDVELYGRSEKPSFTYNNDILYRFYEEAYANAIALSVLYSLHSSQEVPSFIEDFVKNQGGGYSKGWELYDYHCSNLEQWMASKVLFNYDIAYVLKNNHSEYSFEMPKIIDSINRDGWMAVINRYNKWYLMDVNTLSPVSGFKEYNSFWSFGEEGLCMVRLDTPDGYLYGYINEQGEEKIPVEYDHLYSFENGITIAKKEGKYGAIDLNNNIVIPFNLPYEDVRAFRNGRAAVKDFSDLWGVIDTNGNEIVPCVNDRIVL